MSNDLMVRATTYLNTKTDKLNKWVRGGVLAEHLKMTTLQQMQVDAKLRECTPESIYTALLACAVTGLEPGPLKQEAFLIPYWNGRLRCNEAKFVVGWRGLHKQAMRAGGIHFLRTGVVRQGDVFDVDQGTANTLVHKKQLGSGEREILGAYAWAQLTNGHRQIEVMDTAELDKVRAFADSKTQNGSPAWQQWFEEMARKTVARRLCKYLPMDELYFQAQRIEDARDSDTGPRDLEVLDAITDGAATEDTATGGPIAGFAAPALEAKPADPPARRSTRGRTGPIDAKATEAKDPPPPVPSAAPASAPSAPSSSSGSSASPTTASTSISSSPPTASSSSATATTGSCADDAGQSNEPALDREAALDDDATAFGRAEPELQSTAAQQIHGWPATLPGYMLWVGACKTKTEIQDGVGAWKAWAREVMQYDPGDKAAGRAPCDEIQRMGTAFQARWKELP